MVLISSTNNNRFISCITFYSMLIFCETEICVEKRFSNESFLVPCKVISLLLPISLATVSIFVFPGVKVSQIFLFSLNSFSLGWNLQNSCSVLINFLPMLNSRSLYVKVSVNSVLSRSMKFKHFKILTTSFLKAYCSRYDIWFFSSFWLLYIFYHRLLLMRIVHRACSSSDHLGGAKNHVVFEEPSPTNLRLFSVTWHLRLLISAVSLIVVYLTPVTLFFSMSAFFKL